MKTDKELLLSKLYDDNTICYSFYFQQLEIRNQGNKWVGAYNLNINIFWFSYSQVWAKFQDILNSDNQKIRGLTGAILVDHLKRKDVRIEYTYYE